MYANIVVVICKHRSVFTCFQLVPPLPFPCLPIKVEGEVEECECVHLWRGLFLYCCSTCAVEPLNNGHIGSRDMLAQLSLPSNEIKSEIEMRFGVLEQ